MLTLSSVFLHALYAQYAAPPEAPRTVRRIIIVDLKREETMESVYLRDFGEPYNKDDKSIHLIVRSIVRPTLV